MVYKVGGITVNPLFEAAQEYTSALTAVQTFSELQTLARDWGALIPDMAFAVGGMTEADMNEFLSGLNQERNGEFAGREWAERFGAVAMPEVLIHVQVVASEFNAPWGVAFGRLVEHGYISLEGGSVSVMGKRNLTAEAN